MPCRKCQRAMPDGALYCPWCGAAVTPKRATHKRGNGLGTAIRRGKSWTARVIVGWMPPKEGSTRPRAIYRTKGGFPTKREALEHCLILRQQKDRPRGSAPQLIKYWDTYAAGELENLSKDKQVGYRGAWKKLTALHYRPVDQITVTELREVVSAAAHTYYTVKDCKTVLTRLYELAGADGWASKDLPSYIVLPALEEKERVPLNDDEQSALWHLYESGDLRAAVPLLMICTGMMPGELQKLKVENIDLENRKIVGAGLKTKVRKKSAVYLPDEVIPIVEDLIANARPNGYLWPRNEKKWYENYYAALAAAGCRRLEPYSCRHTTATRLAIDKRIAPQTIQRVMRWSSTKMLDRYAHPDETAIYDALNGPAADAPAADDSAPDDSAPGNPAPDDSAPGNPAPGDPAPDDPVPGDPVPGDPAST